MAGLTSQRKGRRGEQEVAILLRPLFPLVRTRRAGGETSPIDRGRDLLGTDGLCVQIKCHGRPQPIQALKEAAAAAHGSEIPVAFVKLSRVGNGRSSPWCVIMEAESFIGLLALNRALLKGATEEPRSGEPALPLRT
jgi:hypothetical protein